MSRLPDGLGAQRALAALRRAFTLVEVLIVVLLLGILASLVVPSLANATAPLPRTVADLLEADFRRARIEALGAVAQMQLVVGADRDRWWLQPAGQLDPSRALPTSLRVLGNGNLAPFAGLALEPTIDGVAATRGPVAFAVFTPEGLRTGSRLELALVARATGGTLIEWRVPPQRSQLTEIRPDGDDDEEDGEAEEERVSLGSE
jgi:prepilin-type N-terminal cleavage/methylation domain-containing protein